MKIIYQDKGPLGTDITIRYPTSRDLKAMHHYANTLSKEKTFVLFQGEKISLKQEKEFLNFYLKGIKERKAVALLLFSDKNLIGIADISRKKLKIMQHLTSIGISVARDHRGKGLGGLLFSHLLKEAKKNIPGIKIFSLAVFANNIAGIRLYKKFGFRKFGLMPKALKFRGRYMDEILMYKNVR